MVNSQETSIGTPEYRQVLDSLDLFSGNSTFPEADIADIVGVLADIKSAAAITFNDSIADIVHNLGLACYQTDGNTMVVAKDPMKALELAYYLTDDSEDTDNRRAVGALLGYPETATEYFIKRGDSLDETSEDEWLPEVKPEGLSGTLHEDLNHFILSPENWREEIEQYIVPLDAAMKEMVPRTYQRLERSAQAHRIGEKVLSL